MEIIYIGALWCPACLIMNKTLKEIEEEQNIKIIKYDYDFDEEEIKKYNVGQILPEIIIGNKKLIGEKTKEEIIQALNSWR